MISLGILFSPSPTFAQHKKSFDADHIDFSSFNDSTNPSEIRKRLTLLGISSIPKNYSPDLQIPGAMGVTFRLSHAGSTIGTDIIIKVRPLESEEKIISAKAMLLSDVQTTILMTTINKNLLKCTQLHHYDFQKIYVARLYCQDSSSNISQRTWSDVTIIKKRNRRYDIEARASLIDSDKQELLDESALNQIINEVLHIQ